MKKKKKMFIVLFWFDITIAFNNHCRRHRCLVCTVKKTPRDDDAAVFIAHR